MATAATPIPYTPTPINSATELSALLSSPLADLRRTSAIKPYLDLLNEIAYHQQPWAADVVRLILECVEQERVADRRLALFYLFDTFCKNRRIAALYRRLLAPLIQQPLVSTYKYSSDATKRQMDKLIAAWRSNAIFDAQVMDGIDARLRDIESGASGKRTADVLGDSDVVHKVSHSSRDTERGRRRRGGTIKCELCCGQAGCQPTYALLLPRGTAPRIEREVDAARCAHHQAHDFCRQQNVLSLRACTHRRHRFVVSLALSSSQRARTDTQTPSPTPQPTALSPQVQETLRVLEVSLAQHPHLLPLLHDIRTMLHTPGVEVAQVAPKIAALTNALQAQQQQQRTTPPPQQQVAQQQPPAGSDHLRHLIIYCCYVIASRSSCSINKLLIDIVSCAVDVCSYAGYGAGQYQPQYAPQQHSQQYQQPAAAPAGYQFYQQQQQPAPGAQQYAYPPNTSQYLQPPPSSYPRTSPERDLKPYLPASKPKTFDTEDLKTSVDQRAVC